MYVFDDTDPEDVAYLGVAKVPLISLAHDKAIRGTFELKQVSAHIVQVNTYTALPSIV